MTLQTYGTFGFLNPGQLAEEPLMLLDFGIEKRQSEKYDFYNDDRDYDGFLFQYTFQGEGVFETEEGSRRLSAGTAFFSCIPEKSRYYLPAGEPENRWEYLYVHFQGPAAVPFFRKIRDSFGPVVTVPADSFPIQLWLNLHEDMTNGRQLRRYEGGDLVYRFLSSLLRTLEEPQRPALTPCVEESIRYMKEHFPEHFSIEELAAYKGLSSAYFTRLFTRETGQSPVRYLTGLRLSHALSLLLNTTMPVEAVARDCGFSCGNYFCKVFRRASGCTPAEYRRRYGADRLRASHILPAMPVFYAAQKRKSLKDKKKHLISIVFRQILFILG